MKQDLKALFDNALSKGHNCGYVVQDGRLYPNYMPNDDFNVFKLKLKKELPKVYKQYEDGKGGEFIEKENRGNWLPPKMASFASSSRFAVASFTQLKDGKLAYKETFRGQPIINPKFEVDLKIFKGNGKKLGGTAPQMDFYFEADNCPHFVEVKCHEIFDSHKIHFAESYKDVETFNILAGIFGLDLTQCDPKKGYITLIENSTILSIKHFDFTQFIRHLMGIVSYCTTTRPEYHDANKYFHYLFYKTKSENFNEIYKELEEEIKLIKRLFADFFKEHHILFDVIYNEAFDTLK